MKFGNLGCSLIITYVYYSFMKFNPKYLIRLNGIFLGETEVVSVFEGVIINETKTTTIQCEAIGYPPPTVIWSSSNEYSSDRVLVSDSVSVPTVYGNVTRVSVNLTITNAIREDTGEYICSANNSISNDDKNVSIIVQCKSFDCIRCVNVCM